MKPITEEQILDELRKLDPDRWFQVLDFIVFLKEKLTREPEEAHTQMLTADDLLHSELVGLWADRSDIGDSMSFARQLRQQAEHRRGRTDDLR